uniref:Serum response factor homolog n=1 Tax=Heterorhabditis bacteriophora TaxID=37862 RepID=A0A1I7XV49_HETBA
MAETSDIAHLMHQLQGSSSVQPALSDAGSTPGLLPNGKKTKGMFTFVSKSEDMFHFVDNIVNAYELSTLTGTQVMLLVASETGHVYTYATKKLQPMISSDTGKALIQTCLNAPCDGADMQPSRTEFTFETGNSTTNPRKRKMNDPIDSNSTSLANFLPTMVPTALFSSFGEDDYNQEDSGEDTDSEEPSEGKEELGDSVEREEKKDEQAELTASLQQTLKDALKVAATTRQQQQKKARAQQPTPSQPMANNSFLAPFLLSGK